MKPEIGSRRFQETSAHPAEPEFYPLEPHVQSRQKCISPPCAE